MYAQLPMSQFRKRLSMRSSSQRQLYGLPGTPGAPPALSSSPRDAASSVTKPKIDAITASFGGGLFMLEVSSPAVMVWHRTRVCDAELSLWPPVNGISTRGGERSSAYFVVTGACAQRACSCWS